MKNTTDCLIIGHNEMDLEKYTASIKRTGVTAGAFRDLNLGFIRWNSQPFHAAGIFNLTCSEQQKPGTGEVLKPITETESFSATIAYLGTYLERRGYTFDYIHSFQAEKEALAEKLKQENILTIAITTTLYVFPLPILEIMDFIRKYNRKAKIIIGGPFIATQHRIADAMTLAYLFKSLDADIYVISSQGETTLTAIIHALKNNLPLEKINNIYYKSGDKNGYASTPLLKEDNKLSRNMVNWELFADALGDSVNLRTSISCPFSCAFCGFPEHAGQYQTADVEVVARELDRLKKIGRVKYLQIIDDTLNVPRERFHRLLRMLIKNQYQFTWYGQFRCQYADEETVALMKESGCGGVFLGLESGNQQILKNMNKTAAVEDYVKGISLLKQYQIMTYGSFIIGFPGETRETLRDTVRLIEETGIDFYRTQLWYCDPLTPIWKQREKYNIKGSHFEWRHATMEAGEACDLIDHIFLTVEKSIWLPQYGFDFNCLCYLLNRGISLDRVKHFIKTFNAGIREKLCHVSGSDVNVSPFVMNRLKNAFNPDDSQEPGDIVDSVAGEVGDLVIDFEMD